MMSSTGRFVCFTELFVLFLLYLDHVSSIINFSFKKRNFKLRQQLNHFEKNNIGSANLDWVNLGFQYRPTDSYVFSRYSNGEWGPLEDSKEQYIPIHIGATSLHYGQSCFEGLKAFATKTGDVKIFRPEKNAERIRRSCERLLMPAIDENLFIESVNRVVRNNLAYVPPYGSGGSLYIRPLLFGSGPRIGLQPSDEYTFLVMVVPVNDYYKGGLHPVDCLVVDYDRAAPNGVGNVKVSGNYAADLVPNMSSKKKGYPISLYLDAKTNQYIEEFSTSNFFAFDNKNNYVTPSSSAILKSITNESLMELALSLGINVEKRKVHINEIFEGNFKEIGACGTAVVITPVSSITYNEKIQNYNSDSAGELTRSLYEKIRAIQTGESNDQFNWMKSIQ